MFEPVEYVDDVTVIHAKNLNDMQAELLQHADDIPKATSSSWTLTVPASAWVSDSDTWAGMTAAYKAEVTAEGVTEATEIDVVSFVSGDLTAASQWLYLRTGADVVTLWSDVKPTADFTLRIMEVK